MRKIVDKNTANVFAFLYSIIASVVQGAAILGISYLLSKLPTLYMIIGIVFYSSIFLKFITIIESLIYFPFNRYLYRNDQACDIAIVVVGIILLAATVIAWIFCFKLGGGWLIVLALDTTVNLFNGLLAAHEIFGMMNSGRIDYPY